MHISQLPDKGWYARYLRQLAAADPEAIAIDPASGWMKHRRTVRELRCLARRALDRRINERAGDHAANVPLDLDLQRDAWDLNARLRQRVRIYQFRTQFMRERFGHLLARHDD